MGKWRARVYDVASARASRAYARIVRARSVGTAGSLEGVRAMLVGMTEPKVLQAKARELAGWLRSKLPHTQGFTLFLFDYGPKGAMAYISSARREDMIRMVRDWLETQDN